ncbi:unnamed protein product [Ectocarpus sp. 6 AP-2014]
MACKSNNGQSAHVTQEDPLVVVASYNKFDNLAHVPRGTTAGHTLSCFRLHRESATMTLLAVEDTLENPAFLRFHPQYNILYACTEDITKDNEVACFSVSATCGKLTHLRSQSAKGKSTCYLELDSSLEHMLFVNYWDSVVGTMPLTCSGLLEPVVKTLKPERPVVARDLKDHLANRQSEPHAHAIVLDPYFGKVAFIPDLGMDVIQQHHYDAKTGVLTPSTTLACGPDDLKPHGPRYIAFHPEINAAYVVNELSSTVSVYEFNAVEARGLRAGGDLPTLRFVQSVSTIPSAFPRKLNTCGRICVDPTGRFVLVSNRGHNSIAVFAIKQTTRCGEAGYLRVVNYCHTKGKTPRHFQFDPSGEFLLSANQDTDSVTVFRFDNETGKLTFTGDVNDVPSPNFVCVFQPHRNGRMRHVAKL